MFPRVIHTILHENPQTDNCLVRNTGDNLSLGLLSDVGAEPQKPVGSEANSK